MLDLTDVISCKLVDSCASDLAVVNAARISFDAEHDEFTDADDKLINYLLKNRHGTPFEHGYFKFLVEAPIFVFREHHRHRAGHSYNEMSGRYTELEGKFYAPARARVQDGKPGHYVYKERAEDSYETLAMRKVLAASYAESWTAYQHLLGIGVAKEQARMVLPVGIYTKMIWSCNPRSLMHFLSLRNAPTAQKEIQMEAKTAELALSLTMPFTHKAFVDNGRIAP